MGKRSKPIISLAAAMHRVTPIAMQAPTAAAASIAAAAAPGASAAPSVSGGNKKRKRGVLISAFHVLMREQDALASQKASLGATAYAARHAELQSKLDALGGLEAYQQLSIAGHSNTKHHAFNTAHWVIDVLASYPQFANLKKYVGSHPPSGGSEASAIAAAAGVGAASATAADEKRLAKRQKERERKRAKKKARKAAEEEEAAAAAAAAAKAAKGSKKKGAASAAAASAPPKKKAQPVDDDANESADEAQAQQDDDHNVSGSDGEEEEGDASGASASAETGPVFSASHRIRLLDVGALTNHYLPYSSEIDCTAIDLNPQHPSVRAVDFFDLDVNDPQYRRAFDVVVLSLVLNFVGDRFRRGEMIKRSVAMLRPSGHARLFVILPSACLRNSRWMNHETFVERCMAPLGLQIMKWKYSTKLAMFEFRRVAVDPVEEEREAAERAAEAEQMADEAAAAAPSSDEEQEDDADDADDPDGSKKFARAQAKAAAKQAALKKAAAASKKKKRKGFQPAGIVLAGDTRNNFSIAWKAD